MTFGELKTNVAALGFEDDVELSEVLLTATNRALFTIFTERCVRGEYEIYHKARVPITKIDEIVHEKEAVSVEVIGRSYSFRTQGEGSYSVTDGSGTITYAFTNGESEHRGFIDGKATIEFFGDFLFFVFDLETYGELFGESIKDIPLSCEHTKYDMTDSVSNFLAFDSLPKDRFGNEIPGAYLENGIMAIPRAFSGKVILTYKCAPKRLSGESTESIIIPKECEELLPLLVASYVWLDDDNEKAEFYAALYRDGMSAVKVYNRVRMDSTYKDVTGWA